MQQPLSAVSFGLLFLIPVFPSIAYQGLRISTQLFTQLASLESFNHYQVIIYR